jgi:hypothetical protein
VGRKPEPRGAGRPPRLHKAARPGLNPVPGGGAEEGSAKTLLAWMNFLLWLLRIRAPHS